MVQQRKASGRMFVKKRDGREEPVHFDKITSRYVNNILHALWYFRLIEYSRLWL